METRGVGRPATGRIRNKTLSLRVTEEEKEIMQNFHKYLQEKYKTKTQVDAIMEMIREKNQKK